MLAFSPLATAPLAAVAPRLPQILAQAANAMALGGVGDAGTGISAQKRGLATDLPLGGHAKVQASVRGQGLAGLPLAGVARGEGAIGSRLQSDVPLSGGGGAQARVDATASDTLDLRDAAWSAIGVQGSAVTVFGLQRHAVAAVEVDITAARSLPLVGNSAAHLHGRGTAATTVVFGITASAKLRVALRGLGDFALGGLAQAECHATGAIVTSLTTAGAGELANLAAGRGAEGLAIEGGAGAGGNTVARAEASVSVVGAGTSDVSGDGTGAIPLSLSLRADGRTAIGAINDGAALLAGEALIGTSIAAQAWETGLSFTGQAAGTILQPREGAATGELRLNAQAQAVSALKGHGIGAIPLPGNSSAISTTHLYAAGQLSLTRGLAVELQVIAKAGRTIAFSGAGGAKALASTLSQSFGTELRGHSVAQSSAAAAFLSIMALSRAGAARGASATHGAARSTVAVARAFTGDVDVHGDSTRQISLGGVASARTPSTSQTSKTVVELTGSSTARAVTGAKSVASVALAGAAHADMVTAGIISGSIGWIIQAQRPRHNRHRAGAPCPLSGRAWRGLQWMQRRGFPASR
ncbi:hypothetical protein [Tabrizicola sp.]|uniref:hypothetical protein n=1 Tax=Tabrizicola sp. TaxID=2005166 RepID=UPI003D2D6752